MPYWTRVTVLERLVQLIEDVELVGRDAIALDTASGGSVDLPVGVFGGWKAFGLALRGADQTPAAYTDRLRALAARLPHSDDSDLAEGRVLVLQLYIDLHAARPAVDEWLGHTGTVLLAALALRDRLTGAEDESHRVLSGIGDLRRSARVHRVNA